jgi:hypothetical protein
MADVRHIDALDLTQADLDNCSQDNPICIHPDPVYVPDPVLVDDDGHACVNPVIADLRGDD